MWNALDFKALTDMAKDRDGNQQTAEKIEEFLGYNTIAFEGGGSVTEMQYRIGTTASGNSYAGYNYETFLRQFTTKLF